MAEPPQLGYTGPFYRSFLDITSFLLFYSCLYNATFPSSMFIHIGLFFDFHYKVARCPWHVALPTYLPRKLDRGGG